jgi:PKD repeat protein
MRKPHLLHLIIIFCLFSFIAIAQTKNTTQRALQEKLLHPPPVPHFSITGLCFGDTTHFINKTQSGVLYTEWSIMNDKGDTLYISKDKDAAYYFKKRGFYTVCLLAYNGHTALKIKIVRIDTITKADFTFRYCYDEFENLSACSDQFVWILPDNSSSTDVSPAYTFSKPGKYPVTLISKNGNKADTVLKVVSVRGDSIGLPNPVFSCKRIDTSSTFEFRAVDSLANTYTWYFGDNQGDDTSGYKVIHHINKSVYTPPVNLFIGNACGVSVDMLDPFAVTEIPKEEKIEFNMVLYPNPVENELSLAISNVMPGKNICIRIIDSNGSILKETKLRSDEKTISFKYNPSHLSKGLYLLQVDAEGYLKSKKFIIR